MVMLIMANLIGKWTGTYCRLRDFFVSKLQSLCVRFSICVAAGLRPSKPQVFHKAVSLFVAQTLPGLTCAALIWLLAL